MKWPLPLAGALLACCAPASLEEDGQASLQGTVDRALERDLVPWMRSLGLDVSEDRSRIEMTW